MKINKTTWLQPEKVFIVSGGASANSLFLEDKKCHKIFFKYFNRFLSEMVEVLHYKLNASGWAILVRVKEESHVIEAYKKQRLKSSKANRNLDFVEPERMISEHFRYFLSSFARRCNHILGRQGVWVKKKFDRIGIDTLRDYKVQFEQICKIQDCIHEQKKKKYRPKLREYDLMNEMDEKSILKSSVLVYKSRLNIEKMPINVRIVRPYSDVLRQILGINKTNQKPSTNHPKME